MEQIVIQVTGRKKAQLSYRSLTEMQEDCFSFVGL